MYLLRIVKGKTTVFAVTEMEVTITWTYCTVLHRINASKLLGRVNYQL